MIWLLGCSILELYADYDGALSQNYPEGVLGTLPEPV